MRLSLVFGVILVRAYNYFCKISSRSWLTGLPEKWKLVLKLPVSRLWVKPKCRGDHCYKLFHPRGTKIGLTRGNHGFGRGACATPRMRPTKPRVPTRRAPPSDAYRNPAHSRHRHSERYTVRVVPPADAQPYKARLKLLQTGHSRKVSFPPLRGSGRRNT